MSEMVDRVAEALCRHNGHDPKDRLFYGQPDGDTAIDWYRPKARVAIAAMREPTEAMKSRGADAEGIDYNGAIGYRAAMEAWREMIDEALK